MSENYFTALSKIDVTEHVEKKGKFSYLSWAYAVAELKKRHPDATWDVKRFDGLPYLKSECGVFVEVGVTVNSIEHSQIHPVLNHQNKPVDNPDAFQINTSIQRALVKAIALHGLGLYIYAGEDLPIVDQEEVLRAAIDAHKETIKVVKDNIEKQDYETAAEAWFELSKEEMQSIWVAPSKGGPFTTKEREIMKSSEFRKAYYKEE